MCRAVPLFIALSIGCGRIGFEIGDGGQQTSLSDSSDSDGTSAGCGLVDNQPPVPTYDCGTVEDQILSGNLAAVSDADLIAWAQNNCMSKPAPSALAAMPASTLFPVNVGSGASCSSGAPPGAAGTAPDYRYTGSGTLDLGSFTGTCGSTNLLGTYDQIRFATVSTSAAINTHYDGCRTIHIDALSGSAILRAFDYATALASEHPVIVQLSSIRNTSTVNGGRGDDVVIATGAMGGNRLDTLQGNDTVVLGGGLLSDDGNDTILDLGGGDDRAYVNRLGILGSSPEGDLYAGPGNDRIYFNDFNSEDIYGGPGDDILSCTGLFGVASCTSYGEWAFLVGGNGSDIISVDGPLVQTAATGGSTEVTGDAGFNILYFQSIRNTANRRVTIDVTTTGSSLLVLGGPHTTSMASTVTAGGAGNVLLVKSGAANTGFTFTGFARTLTY